MSISRLAVAMVTVLFTGPTGTILAQHWGYEGEAGPQNWGKLDVKFAACTSGKNQSPIDLKGFVEADMKPLKLDYKAGTPILSITDTRCRSTTLQKAPFPWTAFHLNSSSSIFIHRVKTRSMVSSFPWKATGPRRQGRQSRRDSRDVSGRRCEHTARKTLGKNAEQSRREERASSWAECVPTATQGTRLLSLQRIAHYAAVQRRRTLVRHKEASYGIQRADRAVFQGDRFANNRPIQSTNARSVLQ